MVQVSKNDVTCPFFFLPSVSNVYPASHDVPERCRWSVCLDGVLTGVREGNAVASVQQS